MSYNEITEQQRQLGNVGRAMMDAAYSEKSDELSNKLAATGRKLTEFGTIYGPKLEDFTQEELELANEYMVYAG